jgi:Tfp pilus assembly protein PilO
MTLSRTYTGAILIAIVGILFWILLMPLYDTVLIQRTALNERNTILENRNTIIANIKALTQEYAQRSTDIERFGSIVPAQKSVPELVSSIQALATQNGLQLTGLSLNANTNPSKDPYYMQSIDMNLNGSYLAFKSFLLALERNIRVIDIINIDASPTSDNSPIIDFRIKGNSYYIK